MSEHVPEEEEELQDTGDFLEVAEAERLDTDPEPELNEDTGESYSDVHDGDLVDLDPDEDWEGEDADEELDENFEPSGEDLSEEEGF